MSQEPTLLERIASGKPVLLAEISPPGANRGAMREAARRLAGKVHALGVSDNRDRVSMAALAAASIAAAEGVEPILHVTTRDRNRVALVSEALGAHALGIRNILCTSGSHQTLGHFRAARNVYDIDPVQLLKAYADLRGDGSLVGEEKGFDVDSFCLGAVASPFADPLPLQVTRLVKKTQAGAKLLITQPVYDLERFGVWWNEVTRRGLHEKVAIVAGVQPLVDGALDDAKAGRRPSPGIPEATLQRVLAAGDPAAQRGAAVTVAVETVQKLSSFKGLRGFCIGIPDDGDLDAALAVIDQSGLGSN